MLAESITDFQGDPLSLASLPMEHLPSDIGELAMAEPDPLEATTLQKNKLNGVWMALATVIGLGVGGGICGFLGLNMGLLAVISVIGAAAGLGLGFGIPEESCDIGMWGRKEFLSGYLSINPPGKERKTYSCLRLDFTCIYRNRLKKKACRGSWRVFLPMAGWEIQRFPNFG